MRNFEYTQMEKWEYTQMRNVEYTQMGKWEYTQMI